MSFLQALVEGSLAQPPVPDVSSPRHSHLQSLVHQISRERDDCQARLKQLQVCHCAVLFLSYFEVRTAWGKGGEGGFGGAI